MLIKFTETQWLNLDPNDVESIEIDILHRPNLIDIEGYDVTVKSYKGEFNSGVFGTLEEARECAESLARAVMGVENNGREKTD